MTKSGMNHGFCSLHSNLFKDDEKEENQKPAGVFHEETNRRLHSNNMVLKLEEPFLTG
jgi:hypothetical protein